jgi:hypothetical protein
LSEEDKQRIKNGSLTNTGSISVEDRHRREGSSSSTSGRASGSTSSSATITAAAPVAQSTLVSLGHPSRAPRSSSSNSISDRSHLTPPQHGLSKSISTGSAHSSASSARLESLTDASTVSGSSVPTPPYAGSHHSRTSLSSHGSGGSGSGESGGRPGPRTYSSRPFQRHVSAPLARDRLIPEESKDTADVGLYQNHFCDE